MPRIVPIEKSLASSAQLGTLLWIEDAYGAATNMKRTLARSPVALRALLEWYPLRNEVAAFLGERGVTLFCHAISTGNACLLCSTYFRRELIEAGEDPAALATEEPLTAVAEYGAALATDPNAIDDTLWSRLAGAYTDAQLVSLTAFGALMIATNVFNSALGVDLDQSLLTFSQGEAHG